MAYTSSLYSMGGVSYDIIAVDRTQEGVDGAVDGLKKVDDQSALTAANLAKVTAAFAALTALSEGAVLASDRVVGLERITSQAAITQGVSTRAMYEYVQSLSNAADPQEEIGATMAYLSRTGLKMNDDLGSVYETLDKIGHATNETSTAVAQELVPAFSSLGMKSQDIAKYSDLLSYSVNTSLFDISQWTTMIRRNGESLVEYKVPLEDTIAVMARMADLGVPQRKILTLVNEAFKEMGSNATVAAKGQEELLKIQEKLNEAQDKGAKTTRSYLEDMQQAGNDMSKLRQLTLAYNRNRRDNDEVTTDLLKQKTSTQATITAAQNAPTPSFIEAIAKGSPNLFSAADLTASVAKSKSASVGATDERVAAGEIVTGSEMANWTKDQMTQAVGKNIDTNTAASMRHLSDIAGDMTKVTGALTLIQGFTQLTSVATLATAAGGGVGSTPILAGMLLGGAGVAGMEATGITSLMSDVSGGSKRGLIEQAGWDTAQYMKTRGKETREQMSNIGEAAGDLVLNINGAITRIPGVINQGGLTKAATVSRGIRTSS
jgi:TP901 family phage tail tape measure protein